MALDSFEYLSEEALSQYKKELDCLIKHKRKEITEKLESARSLGDLSENAEYQEAKEEQLNVETRIAELEDILSRVVVLRHNGKERVMVEMGCVVSLKRDGSEEILEYQIVGSGETDPLKRKISNESPLGSLLLGRKTGESTEVLTPQGKIVYTIIGIV